MNSTMYAPLQGDGRQFRLLVLEPSNDRHAPVECQLNLESFDKRNLKYTALSYVWGDATAPTPILLNGVERQVTLNLDQALRHLRKPSHGVTLWVDALCINQEDLAEKNHQVGMMREIYSGAELVIAWLGSASEDSDVAMGVLGKGRQALLEREGKQRKSPEHDSPGLPGNPMINIERKDSNFDSKNYDERMKEYMKAFKRLTEREVLAMWALLTRNWWSRIWVVQEALLANEVIFKCGNAEVSGGQMSSWTEDSLLAFEIFCHALGSTGQIFPAMSLLGSMREPNAEYPDGLLQILFWYSMREATRPHDHFYGLLGIIPEAHQKLLGAPDYGCRAEDLFTNVARKLVVEFDSLELLGTAGTVTPLRATSPTRLNLPSWVPDWTRQSVGNVMALTNEIPSFSKPEFHFSNDLTELTITGFKFDEIESFQAVPARAKGKMPIWHNTLLTDERTRDDRGPPPLEGLVVALLGPDSHDGREFPKFAAFLQDLEEYRVSVCRREAGDDHDSFDYLEGFLDWIGETRDGRTDEEILRKVFSVEDAESFVAWYHRQTSEDLQFGRMTHSSFHTGVFGTAGFLIFRTSKGSFGLTHAPVAPGDILCAVPTCPSPLVLRKVQFSKYMLVGPTCAIEGTVNGELTKAVEQGELNGESYTLV